MGGYYAALSLSDILEDLASRFIINLPLEEQKSLERVCFQVEQAHWYYEDHVRPQNPRLPAWHLRNFCEALLRASGIEMDGDLATAYDRFLKYKFAVPVCGAIMLNESLDKAVLVRGWKASASWTFPRGKINQNESDRDCAVREVWEETGYDLSPHFDASRAPHPSNSKGGPPPLPEDIELDDLLQLRSGESKLKLFVVPGVPEDAPFETRTRREIGVRLFAVLSNSSDHVEQKIAWFPISSLPTSQNPSGRGSADDLPGHKFYMIAPVVKPLRAWIKRHKKSARSTMDPHTSPQRVAPAAHNAYANIEEANRALQLLFFGPEHAQRQREPVASTSVTMAVPGDIRILQKENIDNLRKEDNLPLLPTADPAVASSVDLFNTAEREQKAAEVLASLLADVSQDREPPPLNPLDALFASADRNKPDKLSGNSQRPLGSMPLSESLQVLREAKRPDPWNAAPQQPVVPAHMPLVALPPPMTVVFPPQAAAPANAGWGVSDSAEPSVMPTAHPAEPRHYAGHPVTPVTVLNAGPPLQPMPRRTITLLNGTISPPILPTALRTDNAHALLNLLNAGNARPAVMTNAARL